MGGTSAGWNFRWVEFYVGGIFAGWNFRWVEFSLGRIFVGEIFVGGIFLEPPPSSPGMAGEVTGLPADSRLSLDVDRAGGAGGRTAS